MNQVSSDLVKYTHLSDEDLDEAEQTKDIMKNMDRVSQRLILAYARGLSDMQETISKVTI